MMHDKVKGPLVRRCFFCFAFHSCVDYGHTFSKIIEMVPAADIMHGEAVNVDGFLCLVIAKRRGMITHAVLDRVFRVMKSIGLPTIHESVELALMVKVWAQSSCRFCVVRFVCC